MTHANCRQTPGLRRISGTNVGRIPTYRRLTSPPPRFSRGESDLSARILVRPPLPTGCVGGRGGAVAQRLIYCRAVGSRAGRSVGPAERPFLPGAGDSDGCRRWTPRESDGPAAPRHGPYMCRWWVGPRHPSDSVLCVCKRIAACWVGCYPQAH